MSTALSTRLCYKSKCRRHGQQEFQNIPMSCPAEQLENVLVDVIVCCHALAGGLCYKFKCRRPGQQEFQKYTDELPAEQLENVLVAVFVCCHALAVFVCCHALAVWCQDCQNFRWWALIVVVALSVSKCAAYFSVESLPWDEPVSSSESEEVQLLSHINGRCCSTSKFFWKSSAIHGSVFEHTS